MCPSEYLCESNLYSVVEHLQMFVLLRHQQIDALAGGCAVIYHTVTLITHESTLSTAYSCYAGLRCMMAPGGIWYYSELSRPPPTLFGSRETRQALHN